MALWSFFLRDLAFLTHQQLFRTKHTVPNLWDTHHQPTPQYFHQSSPFGSVSFFYLSPRFHFLDCHPNSVFFSPTRLSAYSNRGQKMERRKEMEKREKQFESQIIEKWNPTLTDIRHNYRTIKLSDKSKLAGQSCQHELSKKQSQWRTATFNISVGLIKSTTQNHNLTWKIDDIGCSHSSIIWFLDENLTVGIVNSL